MNQVNSAETRAKLNLLYLPNFLTYFIFNSKFSITFAILYKMQSYAKDENAFQCEETL